MNDKLPKFLLPSADMKKAIDRNTRKDADLSLLLDQLDKEKKVALGQLQRRQEAFKKEIIMKNEDRCNKFKVQISEQSHVSDRDGPRLEANRRRRMGLRRASSFDETQASSIVQLPPVINKRYSLPASPITRNSDEEISCCFFKTGSDITPPRRTVDAFKKTLNEQQRERDEAAATENQSKGSTVPKLAAYPSHTKSQEYKAHNGAIRRHSTATAVATADDNSRLLPRRRITLHNLTPIKNLCS